MSKGPTLMTTDQETRMPDTDDSDGGIPSVGSFYKPLGSPDWWGQWLRQQRGMERLNGF
jgi:hypothetical protein